jgi:cyanophycinase
LVFSQIYLKTYFICSKKFNVMKRISFFIISLLLIAFTMLAQPIETAFPKGKLYIIGGGKRPISMAREMSQLANLHEKGRYAVVLPMASSEPDSTFYYFTKHYTELGISSIYNFNIQDASNCHASRIDSIANAAMIFISGGDQNKFMALVANTPVHEAILKAYRDGALVAGTSAGAAVQSSKMITGNELKRSEYTGEYRTIEANNIEVGCGLGLLPTAIIDQHFIWRMRMNRLIAASIEHPEELLIGIDESTAIIVEGTMARVTGESQVVVLKNTLKSKKEQDGLLGAIGLELSIYLPGESFSLIP